MSTDETTPMSTDETTPITTLLTVPPPSTGSTPDAATMSPADVTDDAPTTPLEAGPPEAGSATESLLAEGSTKVLPESVSPEALAEDGSPTEVLAQPLPFVPPIPDTVAMSPAAPSAVASPATSPETSPPTAAPRDPFAPPSTKIGETAHTGRAMPSAPEAEEAVWSAATVTHPDEDRRGLQSGTMVWGLLLLALGMLLVLIGVGVRVDPVIALIGLLAVLGLGLIVVALLPRRRA